MYSKITDIATALLLLAATGKYYCQMNISSGIIRLLEKDRIACFVTFFRVLHQNSHNSITESSMHLKRFV